MSVDSESTISVCIVCRNEADRLGPCLESVRWADEIVLMDLSSTDGSADLARESGARVVLHEPVPIVEMVRNDVAALATGAWILVLDPDERISPALGDELQGVARRTDLDAVIIPRMNCDLGYPPSDPSERYEPQLRMYRRATVSWPTIPNASPSVARARTHRIANQDDLVMIHDRNRTIPEVVDRIARYATLQAQAMVDRGEVFSARAMVVSLGSRAMRKFVRGGAWKDGVPGLLRAGILVGFHFYIWAAFWQLSGAKRTPQDDRFVRRLGLSVNAMHRALTIATSPIRAARRLVRRT